MATWRHQQSSPPVAPLEPGATADTARRLLLEALPTLADESFSTWTERWVAALAHLLGADQVVFYQAEGPDDARRLRAVGGYAAPLSMLTEPIAVGEGLLGQTARSCKPRYFEQPNSQPQQQFICRSGLGNLQLGYVLLHPLCYQGKLLGVIEAAARHPLSHDRRQLLQELNISLAAALSGALQQQELRRLYEASRRQAERLAEQEAILRQNIEELKTTQEQLVQAEKRATLGQLVSGIAHEINTPIGAIKASAGLLEESMLPLVRRYTQLATQTPPALLPHVMQLCEAAVSPSRTAQLTTREERTLRRQLTHQCAERGLQPADELAATIIMAGLHNQLDTLQALWPALGPHGLMETLHALGALHLHIDNIAQAADRTNRIMAALRSFTQQQNQHVAQPLLLPDSLQRVLALHQNQLRYDITLRQEIEPLLPPVLGFADDLDQVWTNLVSNALQAMNGPGTLTVRAHLTPLKRVRVEVADTGPGIPPDVQAHIFEPFFTTKAAGEGTGLGLHLCRQIVERHGGHMAFTSKPTGTLFWVELPAHYPGALEA